MVLMGVRFRSLSSLDFVVARFDLLVDMRMWITEPPAALGCTGRKRPLSVRLRHGRHADATVLRRTTFSPRCLFSPRLEI